MYGTFTYSSVPYSSNIPLHNVIVKSGRAVVTLFTSLSQVFLGNKPNVLALSTQKEPVQMGGVNNNVLLSTKSDILQL